MRVLYFSETFTVHDHRFLTSLANSEHEVTFVRLWADERDMSSLDGLKNIHIGPSLGTKKDPGFFELINLVGTFSKITTRVDPDIIHAGPIQNCAFLASLASPAPLLAMSWGFDLMDIIHRRWIWKQTASIALRRAAYYTSDAQATQQAAFQLGADPSRSSLIPWGVDHQLFKPGPRQHPIGKAATFTLFCNRSWEPTYGVDVLAQAFVKVARERPQARLLLLGNGSMQTNLIRIFEQGGCLDNVELPGRIPQQDLPSYYHRADLYITPSHIDGSSVSLMEALACGLPTLASDIPGNLPWVEENENGWTFPDGDVDTLAAKILYAIDNPALLPDMSVKAKQLASQKANWEINFSALLKTYQDTLHASTQVNR